MELIIFVDVLLLLVLSLGGRRERLMLFAERSELLLQSPALGVGLIISEVVEIISVFSYL